MGGNHSTPSSSSSPSSNPNSTLATAMPSSNSSASKESKPQLEPVPESKHLESEAGAQGSSDPPPPSEKPPENSETKEDGSLAEGESGEEGEEVGECGFCLYMKGGGCANEFIAWEKCVEEGDRDNEDIAEKCFELTSALKKCMEAHTDYYGPLLDAEKAAHEMAEKEIEEEKEKEREIEGVTQVEESAKASAAEDSAKGGVLNVPDRSSETKD